MSNTELKDFGAFEELLHSKDGSPDTPQGIKAFFEKASLEFYESNNINSGGTDVVLRGTFPAIGFDELAIALKSLGGEDWHTHFPDPIRNLLGAVKLNEAGIRLNLGLKVDLAFLDFQLEFHCPAWDLLDHSLSIGLTKAHFFINDPLNNSDCRQVWAEFEGTLTAMGLEFNVKIRAPELFILAEYHAEKAADVVNKAMGELPAPPKAGFNIIKLSAVAGEFCTILLDANVPLEWVLGDGKKRLLHVNASLSFNALETAGAKNGGFPFPISGWQFEADCEEGFPIQALLEKLAAEVKGLPPLSAPETIHGFSILGFSLSYDVPTKDFKLSASGLLTISETQKLTMRLDVEIAHQQDGTDDGTYKNHFGGVIQFAGPDGELLEFDLVFETSGKGKTFLALYRDSSGKPASISDLVSQIFPEVGKQIPETLSLTIKQALYAYAVESQNNAVQNQKPKHLFGIEIDGGINLSDIKLPELPLIGGSVLPPDQRLELAFRVLAPSEPFSQTEIAGLESLVNNGLGLPPDEIKELALQTSLKLGAETRHLNLPVKIGDAGLAKSGVPAPDVASASAPSQVTAVGGDGVKWLSIQKSFGPVHVERLGLKLDGGEISGVLDASLSVSALTIGLSGLTMSSPLNRFDPQFSLQGMSIDFSSEALEIGGSFLRQELERKIDGTDKTEQYVAYGGMAIIRTSKLTLSAIGSYTLVSGHPSLFIYAVMNYPLGGPPFFFVTGLAAGFGFNRGLVMPGVDDVKSFPLVEQVRGGDSPSLASPSERQNALVKQLAALESYIPAQVGEYFLAVGIRFTSFKIVDSFALLAVQFGRQVEIDLLGSSLLIAPAGAEANVTPVARAELALRARYVPDEGFLSVIGKLTSDSYILSKDCHLQGGFAFYAWFSNEHAGDFVLTLGGYHPQFDPPAHYPQVPRLGVNWQVSDSLAIKGESYFALTPHAIMAGGNLEAVWHEGPVRAWFKAGIDFLLEWQPYFYDARAYVSIGASYTLESFGNSTISAELGADLHVWGPDFAMTADVHWYVFSIHIEYIPNPKPPPEVTWESFQSAFLPATEQACEVHAISGLLHQTGSGKDAYGVLDMKGPAFAVNTTIPVNRLQFGPDKDSLHAELNFRISNSGVYFADKEFTRAQPFTLKTDNGRNTLTQSTTDFQTAPPTPSKTVGLPGVRPMNVAPGDFDSLLKIQIQRIGGEHPGNVESEFTVTPVLKSAPAALWGEQNKSASENLNPKSSLMPDTLMGFELRPKAAPTPGESHSIAVAKLQSEAKRFDSISWQNSKIGLTDPTAAIYDSASSPEIDDCRNALLKALGITAYRFDFSHAPSSGWKAPSGSDGPSEPALLADSWKALVFLPQIETKQ